MINSSVEPALSYLYLRKEVEIILLLFPKYLFTQVSQLIQNVSTFTTSATNWLQSPQKSQWQLCVFAQFSGWKLKINIWPHVWGTTLITGCWNYKRPISFVYLLDLKVGDKHKRWWDDTPPPHSLPHLPTNNKKTTKTYKDFSSVKIREEQSNKQAYTQTRTDRTPPQCSTTFWHCQALGLYQTIEFHFSQLVCLICAHFEVAAAPPEPFVSARPLRGVKPSAQPPTDGHKNEVVEEAERSRGGLFAFCIIGDKHACSAASQDRW